MDIIYLVKVLIRRKWIILFSLLIGIIGGLIFRSLKKKEYVSYSQYATGLFQTSKVSLQLNEIFDINQIDFRLTNIIETFRTPTVMGMMSYDLLLHDLESTHPFRILTEKQKTDTSYIRADLKKAAEILHDRLSRMKLLSTYNPEEKKIWDLINLYKYDEGSLLQMISIDRVAKTDYITIRCSSENPELSAYVVNEMGIKFKEFYTSVTATSTKESLNKLDSLRQTKRNEVDDLRSKLQAFRAKIGTPNPGDAATAAMTGLQELTSSLTQQQAKLNDLKQERSSIIDQLATVNNNSTAPVNSNNNNNADEILLHQEENK